MSAKARRTRCPWAQSDSLLMEYHDAEWGVPLRDDRKLFELLVLEGAQAGLSWRTVLAKRDAYRKVFHGFEPSRVARMTDADVRRLMTNGDIVRNRLKIASAIRNAQALLTVAKTHGSFSAFVWGFVRNKPQLRRPRRRTDVPARTTESDAMSKALREAGFSFVGSTICYAFMQAAGLVNDHLTSCFRSPKRRAAA